MENKIYLWLVVLILFPAQVSAHGSIPVPLEAINNALDEQLSKKIDYFKINSTTLPPIADDLDALISKDKAIASDAYKRLRSQENKTATEIIKRLSDPETTLLTKKKLISLLARLRVPGTDKFIIEHAEELRNLDDKTRKLSLNTLYHQTFRSLSGYDDISTGVAYADNLLSNENLDPNIHARALEFLASSNVKSAGKWLDKYDTKNNHIGIQYASLYLSLKLGMDYSIPNTINFLKDIPKSKDTYSHETHLLLSSLLHSIKTEELQEIITLIKKNNSRFTTDKKIMTYPILSMLYTGNNEQKEKAAHASLTLWSSNKEHLLESLKHMIKANDATPYITSWKLHHPVLRKYLHHLGYAIKINNSSAEFITTDSDEGNKTPNTDLLAKALISSFVNNDINSFTSSILINKDLLKLIQQNPNNPSDNDKLDKHYSTLLLNSTKSWESVYSKAKELGFDWSEVKLISSNSNILVNIDGSQFATISISINDNNKKHIIFIENCFLFDNKWHSLSNIQWKD